MTPLKQASTPHPYGRSMYCIPYLHPLHTHVNRITYMCIHVFEKQRYKEQIPFLFSVASPEILWKTNHT